MEEGRDGPGWEDADGEVGESLETGLGDVLVTLCPDILTHVGQQLVQHRVHRGGGQPDGVAHPQAHHLQDPLASLALLVLHRVEAGHTDVLRAAVGRVEAGVGRERAGETELWVGTVESEKRSHLVDKQFLGGKSFPQVASLYPSPLYVLGKNKI